MPTSEAEASLPNKVQTTERPTQAKTPWLKQVISIQQAWLELGLHRLKPEGKASMGQELMELERHDLDHCLNVMCLNILLSSPTAGVESTF